MSELSNEDAIHTQNNTISNDINNKNIFLNNKRNIEDIDDIIIEENKSESNIEELEEDEDFTISSKENENNINSDIDEEEEKKNKLNVINIYRRHFDTQSSMKKKVKFYLKSNKRTILKRKKYYVHQLLQRWWYALPAWPPLDWDPTQKLRENKLRLVEEKNWKKEVELNSDNFEKCVELPGFKYVYVTKEGKVYDFRPEEGKPSFNNLMKLDDIELHQNIVNFNNLMKLDDIELHQNIVKALQNQLNDLNKKDFFSEKELKMNIKKQLKIAKNNLSILKGKNNK